MNLSKKIKNVIKNPWVALGLVGLGATLGAGAVLLHRHMQYKRNPLLALVERPGIFAQGLFNVVRTPALYRAALEEESAKFANSIPGKLANFGSRLPVIGHWITRYTKNKIETAAHRKAITEKLLPGAMQMAAVFGYEPPAGKMKFDFGDVLEGVKLPG